MFEYYMRSMPILEPVSAVAGVLSESRKDKSLVLFFCVCQHRQRSIMKTVVWFSFLSATVDFDALSLFFLHFHDVDVVPLLSSALALLHAAFFIPLVISESIVESKDYDCEQKAQIQAGLISSLSLYAASLLLECLITAVGLRGGPLQVRKRRLVAPLLYVELSLVAFSIIIASWNTYLAQSNSISSTCWSNNPCKYARDVIPAACTSGASEEDFQLTQPCANVLLQREMYSRCFGKWLDYASTW